MDANSLDAIEGEGINYERKNIEIQKPDGQIVTALTYTVINPQAGLTTNIDYVRYIIVGLRERSIPDAYIEKVKGIARANNPRIAEEVDRL